MAVSEFAWEREGGPTGEQHDRIEMSHGSEARGKHDEVLTLPAEREASPRGAFEYAAISGQTSVGGVAAARVGDGGDNVREGSRPASHLATDNSSNSTWRSNTNSLAYWCIGQLTSKCGYASRANNVRVVG
nr:hypothetical protein Iba_chr03aCG15470 [Ipomoea batatas]